MKNNADEILIKLIKQHDQKALESLYKKYYYSLCDFAFTIVKRVELAEEIVSDVFFNIWIKRDSLDIKSNLKAYLFLAARNQSINYYNKYQINFEEVDISKSIVEIPECIDANTGIEYEELENEIQNILEELPPQRRLIFKLHRLEGLKYREIAETLSISVNTVQKQMIEASKYIEKYKPRLKALLFVTFLFSLF